MNPSLAHGRLVGRDVLLQVSRYKSLAHRASKPTLLNHTPAPPNPLIPNHTNVRNPFHPCSYFHACARPTSDSLCSPSCRDALTCAITPIPDRYCASWPTIIRTCGVYSHVLPRLRAKVVPYSIRYTCNTSCTSQVEVMGAFR